jgi:hypothetical protein
MPLQFILLIFLLHKALRRLRSTAPLVEVKALGLLVLLGHQLKTWKVCGEEKKRETFWHSLVAGDRVVVMGVGIGTWAEKGSFQQKNVYKIGKTVAKGGNFSHCLFEGKEISFEMASSLSAVCTASALLAHTKSGKNMVFHSFM